MPCYYTGTREGDLELHLQENGAELVQLTRMLCSTIKGIQKVHGVKHLNFILSKEAKAWWKKHNVKDKARRNR